MDHALDRLRLQGECEWLVGYAKMAYQVKIYCGSVPFGNATPYVWSNPKTQ
jgi:hypothetical protein